MNVTRKWKRVLAVGCSHGELALPGALKAVLRMRDEWKPSVVIHLGDAFDTTAFRAGALGGGDDIATSIHDDLCHGGNFLRELRPSVFCLGNHENRLVKLAGHYNEIVACAAQTTLDNILAALPEKCVRIPYTVHEAGWHRLGGYLWGHGHLYGENYLRDSAETWGNCVVAHAHRAGMAKGRRLDNPTAYGVGTLCDVPAMGYASGRRSTLAWSHGLVWGEVCDDSASLHLHEWQRGEKVWRLPI